MSDGTTLERRHLGERAQPRGGAHHRRPGEEPEPYASRVVVRRELRCQAVERVRDPRAHRDEQARAARGAAQAERSERDRRERAQRDPGPRPLRVGPLARRRGEREQRHAGRDREHRRPLPATDGLAEPARRDREQEDEARPEQGLDERERRPGERVRLQDPAGEPERRPGEPARPTREPGEEREPQRPLRRLLAHPERLQRDPDGVERRRAERCENADQEVGHRRS